jgi:F0F1-type ATP synthase membrane subunit b/b'
VTVRNENRLSSHVDRPEFVTSQVKWAHQDLLHFIEEATQSISRDVTTTKADLKMLESPSKTLVKKHPEYVQRLQDTLDAARRVAEEIEKQAEPARTEARQRGYIS